MKYWPGRSYPARSWPDWYWPGIYGGSAPIYPRRLYQAPAPVPVDDEEAILLLLLMAAWDRRWIK